VERIGPRKLRSFLLTSRAAVRRYPRAYQQALSTHLSGHLLEALLRQLEVNVVLDVGANRGQFGRGLRELGFTGRIVSYEPVSTNLAQLREAAAADPNWMVEAFALGDVDSTADMKVSAGAGKLSSLLPSSDFGRKRFANMRDEVVARETIQVRRLDGVCHRAFAGIDRPRAFLKLDTQGYDLLALAGAGEYLKDFVGLQSEVSCIPIYTGMPHLTEQIAVYEDAGFAAAGLFPVTRDNETLAVIEFDLLMVRREAI
jgi:FkbM family methyltransferase